VTYEDTDGKEQTVRYAAGEVKLDWRLDWPGRWWLLKVHVEPFGREHASAGGSYDTGVQIMKDIYESDAPIAVPYESIHMIGDTKKMSASKGTALSAAEGLQIMPSEVLRFFMLSAPLKKKLEFDAVNGVVKLMDEFAALAAKIDRTEDEEQLLYVCTKGLQKKTVSRVPFSHLVASYQASLKDVDRTLEVIRRTEYSEIVDQDADIIKAELKYIGEWLKLWAPEDVKFELRADIKADEFTEQERTFLQKLGDKVAAAPEDADGAWFHDAIYGLKDEVGLEPKELFSALYRLLIGKTSGPRAGYFLSILPRDWLVKRLKLEA
jgi:lysyl-tRNA synthetase class 1